MGFRRRKARWEIIFDDENKFLLDHIEVRLESSPTQFLDALGLPFQPNGQEFPLQSWIDLQGTNLFDWEDGTVDGVAIEGVRMHFCAYSGMRMKLMSRML